MTTSTRALGALAALFIAASAQAGSSLNVVLTVVFSTGACGTAVVDQAVSVSCGAFASLPTLPPVSTVSGASQQTVLGGTFAPFVPPFIGGAAGASAASSPNGTPDGLPPTGDPARPDDPGSARVPDGDSDPELPSALPDRALRQVGVLPAWATGHSPMALYSSGANVSSWRVVSNDNAQHVELTISW